jgi:hypothetical protein
MAFYRRPIKHIVCDDWYKYIYNSYTDISIHKYNLDSIIDYDLVENLYHDIVLMYFKGRLYEIYNNHGKMFPLFEKAVGYMYFEDSLL